MGVFSDLWKIGFYTGKYICEECGARMHFENDNEDTLVCDSCGYSVYIDDYGNNVDDYDRLSPAIEPLLEEMDRKNSEY